MLNFNSSHIKLKQWDLKVYELILKFFYERMCWVFFAAGGFSLVAMGRVYSLGAVQGLLIAVASLVA